MSEIQRETRGNANYVTLVSFDATMDLAIVEAAFRNHGIHYRIRDGHTVHVAPYLSGAIGGIRFQVRKGDTDRAVALLAELGVPIEQYHEGSPFLEWFERRTGNWPLIGSVAVTWRLMLVAGGFLLLIVPFLFLCFAPSLEDQLVEVTWCVDSVLVKGKVVQVRSTSDAQGLRLVVSRCEESIHFSRSGSVSLPGFNTPEKELVWEPIGRHSLRINGQEDPSLYTGNYDVAILGSSLHLRSAAVDIRAHAWHFDFGF